MIERRMSCAQPAVCQKHLMNVYAEWVHSTSYLCEKGNAKSVGSTKSARKKRDIFVKIRNPSINGFRGRLHNLLERMRFIVYWTCRKRHDIHYLFLCKCIFLVTSPIFPLCAFHCWGHKKKFMLYYREKKIHNEHGITIDVRL